MIVKNKLLGFLLVTTIFVLVLPAVAYANSANLVGTGKSTHTENSQDIAVEKLVTQIWLHKGYAEVEEVYQFYNTGQSQDVTMGIPELINSKASLKYGIYNFHAYVDGKPMDSQMVKTSDQTIGTNYGSFNWHVNSFYINERQRRIVVHRYWVRIIPWENKLTLPLDPASTWKGNIGEAYIAVYLMGGLTERDLVYPEGYGNYTGKYSIMPTGFSTSPSQITWMFSNYKPARNLQIEIFPDPDYIPIEEAHASGAHSEGDVVYALKNVLDADPATVWGEGGPGPGEWITLKFPKKQWVREFRIIPGYASLEGMFRYYNRPKNITLVFPKGITQHYRLKDELEMQYLPVQPVQTDKVMMRIDSVYKGIYPDVTYVSEIEVGQIGTKSKVDPTSWKIGLDQLEEMKLRPRYSITELITVAVTAFVFIFILWQVIVAYRLRKQRAEKESG
ncbi:MAG TPA: hypothetical protein VGK02_00725 [Candidatus Aquicultor sp.]|jgi:hypothetical protein